MDRVEAIMKAELIDDVSVAALRRLGPDGRLQMLDRMVQAGMDLMASRVSELHPDWDEARVRAEVARRVRNAAA